MILEWRFCKRVSSSFRKWSRNSKAFSKYPIFKWLRWSHCWRRWSDTQHTQISGLWSFFSWFEHTVSQKYKFSNFKMFSFLGRNVYSRTRRKWILWWLSDKCTHNSHCCSLCGQVNKIHLNTSFCDDSSSLYLYNF